MEILVNTSNPIVILSYTIIAVCMIILGKKLEVPVLPGTLIAGSILLLIIHSITLEGAGRTNDALISQTYMCLAYDFILLLLSFISYLWVDDIVAKKKNKKSYDDSLSWFWDKI